MSDAYFDASARVSRGARAELAEVLGEWSDESAADIAADRLQQTRERWTAVRQPPQCARTPWCLR